MKHSKCEACTKIELGSCTLCPGGLSLSHKENRELALVAHDMDTLDIDYSKPSIFMISQHYPSS